MVYQLTPSSLLLDAPHTPASLPRAEVPRYIHPFTFRNYRSTKNMNNPGLFNERYGTSFRHGQLQHSSISLSPKILMMERSIRNHGNFTYVKQCDIKMGKSNTVDRFWENPSNENNKLISYSKEHCYVFSKRRCSRFSFARDNYNSWQDDDFSTKLVNLSAKAKSHCNNKKKAATTVNRDWEEIEISLAEFHRQRICNIDCTEYSSLSSCIKREITSQSIYNELRRFSGVVRLQTMMELFRAEDSTKRMLTFFGCLRTFCTLIGDPKFGIMIISKGHIYLPPVKVTTDLQQNTILQNECESTDSNVVDENTEETLKSTRQRVSPTNRLGGNQSSTSRWKEDLLSMLSTKTKVVKRRTTTKKVLPLSSITAKKSPHVESNKENNYKMTSKFQRTCLERLPLGLYQKKIQKDAENGSNINIKPKMLFRPKKSLWDRMATKDRIAADRARATRERASMFTMLSKRRMCRNERPFSSKNSNHNKC